MFMGRPTKRPRLSPNGDSNSINERDSEKKQRQKLSYKKLPVGQKSKFRVGRPHAVSNDDSVSDVSADDRRTDEDAEDILSDSNGAGAQDDERRHQNELRNLSFGALADAQDALSSGNHRKRSASDAGHGKEEKLQGLRERLVELRERRTGKSNVKNEGRSKAVEKDDHRSSKHAPTEQSSKKQVTRRREITETAHLYDASFQAHKLQGDPRFNAAAGGVDREKVRKNYAFLSDYAQKELQDLRDTLEEGKKRKRNQLTEDEEGNLKKEIVRRENRMKAEARREQEREVASRHKREERQKVKEGKTPYYMKRGQIKEMARDEIWQGMKKKDQEKSEQKRSRRKEAKEMKRKPDERRVQ